MQIKQLRSVDALRERLTELGLDVAVDDTVDADGPLAQPLTIGGRTIGNRFAILPMEGWDGTDDGRPTELVRATLAAVRIVGRQAHLGWRSGRRDAGRPRQSAPARHRPSPPSASWPHCAPRWWTST